MNAEVRHATPDDAAELTQLCAEHACYERAQFNPDGHTARLAAALSESLPPLHAWIACIDGVVVGYATATVEFSTWSARAFTHMDCLFVREAARDRGIGKQLMQAVADFAHAQGHAQMQWQTPDWNHDAARFYRREGGQAATKLRFTRQLPGTETA